MNERTEQQRPIISLSHTLYYSAELESGFTLHQDHIIAITAFKSLVYVHTNAFKHTHTYTYTNNNNIIHLSLLIFLGN